MLGATTFRAGLHLVTYPLGISVGSLGAGIIMNRTGRYYVLGLVSLAVFNLGTGLFCTLALGTPAVPQYVYLLLFGIGYGAALTVGTLALIAAVKHEEQATTTSTSYLFRAVGSTLGASLGTAVFQTALRGFLHKRLGASPAAREIVERVLRDFTEVAKVRGPWREVVVGAYMDALRAVFGVAFAMGTLALLSAAMMREHKLHKTLDRK